MDPQNMYTWALAMDEAALKLRAALERVDAEGGAQAGPECDAAKIAAAAIPPPFEGLPALQQAAAQRVLAAAAALPVIPPPGEGDPRLRIVHLAEIECVIHAGVARAQAARFIAFAGNVTFPGPLQPALVVWSCHWDAMACHHDALGRLVAGADPAGVDPALVQTLVATIDAMAAWIDTTEEAFKSYSGPDAAPADLDPELKRSFDTYGDTIATDRAALAEWRTIADNPDWLVQPQGHPALARVRELDLTRARLHTARMEVAARINAASAATN